MLRLLPLIVGFGVFAVYFPGLRGGFLFDDFTQIVFNPALDIRSLAPDELWRAAMSSDAGPLGRPLAMVTFALERYVIGLDPFYYKFSNVLLHIANGALAGWLATLLLRALRTRFSGSLLADGDCARVALIASAWWALHPLGVTSVLYVVQRMNSLSAFFSLVALIIYCHYRLRLMHGRSGLWQAPAGLLAMTALSILAKESGVLTIGYAALIELVFMRFSAARQRDARLIKAVFIGSILAGILCIAAYLLRHPDWFVSAYAGRPFDVVQRVLTEARVLWFYLWLIFVPNHVAMALYHDDFVISNGLFDPPITALAVIGHLAMCAVAVRSWRTKPMVSFGIGWFYVGHLVESTVIPLELVHEHRNYLPMFGPIVAMTYLFFSRGNWNIRVRSRSMIGATLVAVSALATLAKASDMGDSRVYPLLEARRHPESARANFDAGHALTLAIQDNRENVHAYFDEAWEFYRLSARANSQALPPLIGMMELAAVSGRPIPKETIDELARRLRTGLPPNGLYFVARSLNQILSMTASPLSPEDGEALYLAALDNPRLSGKLRAHMLTSYGLFAASVLGDPEKAVAMLSDAVATAPGSVEFRVLLAGALADDHRIGEAQVALAEAERLDVRGYFRDEILRYRRVLNDGRGRGH